MLKVNLPNEIIATAKCALKQKKCVCMFFFIVQSEHKFNFE
jgi:hypothetical protein